MNNFKPNTNPEYTFWIPTAQISLRSIFFTNHNLLFIGHFAYRILSYCKVGASRWFYESQWIFCIFAWKSDFIIIAISSLWDEIFKLWWYFFFLREITTNISTFLMSLLKKIFIRNFIYFNFQIIWNLNFFIWVYYLNVRYQYLNVFEIYYKIWILAIYVFETI